MSICGGPNMPDLLQSLEHFQNPEERGKEANMGICFVKQDFPPEKQTTIQSPKGAEMP